MSQTIQKTSPEQQQRMAQIEHAVDRIERLRGALTARVLAGRIPPDQLLEVAALQTRLAEQKATLSAQWWVIGCGAA